MGNAYWKAVKLKTPTLGFGETGHRADIPCFDSIDHLEWNGPEPEFEALGARLDAAVTTGESRPRVAPRVAAEAGQS
jgi:hypothetical protein